MSFHEVLFPLDISLVSRGGPVRQTDIVTTGSGREERNQRWYHSRRKYNAGYGVKSVAALALIIEFFEERRGRLYGFRWRDRLDWKSCAASNVPQFSDQPIATGDGVNREFQLVKTYGGAHAPYVRAIRKPVAGSVSIGVGGAAVPSHQVSIDATTGVVTFAEGYAPASGVQVTAGFLFDTPVRFDSDELQVDFAAFEAGEIPEIPVIEILQDVA